MRGPRIDFGGARRPLARPALLLAVAAALAAALGAVEASRLREVRDQLREAARATAAARRTPPAPAPAAGAEIAPARAAAINRVVGRLNLPWHDLFGALEAARPGGVALLALEADGAKGRLRLLGEARDAGSMFEFVGRLGAGTALAGVHLERHETSERDPDRPLRFQIDAQWRGAP